MIKLNYQRNYKSIKQFQEIEIEDFSVITGLNGSGKSHLLQAIDTGAIQLERVDNEEIILYNYDDFNIFNVEEIKPNSNNSVNNIQRDFIIEKRIKTFMGKSNSIESKLNTGIFEILKTFELDNNIYGIDLHSELQHNLISIHTFNWSSSEIIDFHNILEKIKAENINLIDRVLKNPKHKTFAKTVGNKIYKIHDFKEFNFSLINLILKRVAFDIIKNFNFSSQVLSIDIAKLKKKFSEHSYSVISTQNHANLTLEDQNYNNIVTVLKMQYNFIGIEFFEEVIQNIPQIYSQLNNYFKKKCSSSTLQKISLFNTEDKLISPIKVGSGFFNLKEVEVEEKKYQIDLIKNQFNKFKASIGENIGYYDDKIFIEKFGQSPVETLNKVLTEYDCNGYIFKSSKIDSIIGINYDSIALNISLYNVEDDFETDFESLSSGEKTLIALAFSIYKLRRKQIFVKVLLMDEIDSALHPQMSKRLISVLYSYFYKELKIKVIISTHSPSTVAFAPENSLLIMRKNEEPRLIKVDKDAALKELTIGVPSFSINYENRRQVFVESKYDVEYYGALYDIFKNYLNKEISLNFIASGDVQKDKNGQPVSNCTVVRDVTKTLREAGSNSIYGIVDWDLAKSKDDNPHVITLGFDSRYSIENYILDPLFIGFLLIIEKIKDFKYFGLNDKNKVSDLYSISIEECQLLINKIEYDFLEKNIINQNTPKEYTTTQEIKLLLSEELATMQGHELEKNYFKVYPELNKFKGSADNHFKNHLIKKVLEEFVNYIPMDLLTVFREIQK